MRSIFTRSVDKKKGVADVNPISEGYGCYVVNEDALTTTPRIKADIVFLHGLRGNRYRTWASGNVFWPRDLLSKEDTIEDVRIVTFGYDAGVFGPLSLASQNNVLQHADKLLQDLRSIRTGKEEWERPIIFVAHSLGGLVVKQALDTSKQDAAQDERSGMIFRCTYGVIFLGTPHRGGNGIELARTVAKIASVSLHQPNKPLLQELEKNSSTLMLLLRSFARMIESNEIKVYSFLEEVPVAGLGLIVDSASGYLDNAKEQRRVLRANHMEMARFASRDSNYQAVLAAVLELLEGACAVVEAKRPPKTIANNVAPTSQSPDFRVPMQIPFHRNQKFAGRETELGNIQRSLEGQKSNNLSILAIYGLAGTGGMGKTQLSIEYAYRHEEDYSAVFWVNGTSIADAHASFFEIATAIVKEQSKTMPTPNYIEIARKLDFGSILNEDGVLSADPSNAGKVKNAVLSWLSLADNRSWLMIFDNYDDPDLLNVQDFLPKRNGSVIITSRNEIEVSSLAQTADISGLEVEAATSLLLAVSATKATTQAEEDARKVVEYLECMPLAIEHAGVFTKRMRIPLPDYINYYEKAFTRIHKELPQVKRDYRYQTAMTTWEVSLTALKERCPKAVDLLLVCSFLDSKDIWEELFYTADAPLDDKLDLKSWISHLMQFSLVKHTITGSIFIHKVVHSWTRERMGQEEKAIVILWISQLIRNILGRPQLQQMNKEWDHVLERRFLPHLTAYSQHIEALFSASTDSQLNLELLKNPSVLSNIRDISKKFYYHGELELALKWNGHALACVEKALGKEHPNTLEAMSNMGVILFMMGRYDQSMQWHEPALAAMEKILGNDDSATLETVDNMGRVLRELGRHEESMHYLERALAGKERTLGDLHTSTLQTVHNMALALQKQGRRREALEWHRRALSAREEVMGKDHPTTLLTLSWMANLFIAEGEFDEASYLCNRVLAGREIIFGKNHIRTLETVHQMARILKNQGNHHDAWIWYMRAASGFEETLGKDHHVTKRVSAQLVAFKLELRNSEKAQEGVAGSPEADSIAKEYEKLFCFQA